jgi:hypothetical protein
MFKKLFNPKILTILALLTGLAVGPVHATDSTPDTAPESQNFQMDLSVPPDMSQFGDSAADNLETSNAPVKISRNQALRIAGLLFAAILFRAATSSERYRYGNYMYDYGYPGVRAVAYNMGNSYEYRRNIYGRQFSIVQIISRWFFGLHNRRATRWEINYWGGFIRDGYPGRSYRGLVNTREFYRGYMGGY